MRWMLLLLFPLTIFGQVSWLDPQHIIEHQVIPGVDSVTMKMITRQGEVPVYLKKYWNDTWSMAMVEKRDFKNKIIYMAEYSQDSSAFAEYKMRFNQTTNSGLGYKGNVFYQSGWEYEDDLLISKMNSDMEGKNMIVYRTENEYYYDDMDRVVKMESFYSADFYDYSRKTIVEFKYNEDDQILEEKQKTVRGIIPLHRGFKKYIYDTDGYLVKYIVRSNDHTETTEYTYNGWGNVEESVSEQGDKLIMTFNEYDDSLLIRQEIITEDGGHRHRSCSYFNNHGKLEIKVINKDSTVYQHYENDTIQSIMNYKLNTAGEVIKEQPMLSTIYKDGKLIERNVYSYSYDKQIHDKEKYFYDDKNRVEKFVLESFQNTQPLYELVKKYEYGPKGYLYKVEESYPRSGVSNVYIYDVAF